MPAERRLGLGRLFAHFAKTRGEQVALVEHPSGRCITWYDLERHTNRLARAYASRGVRRDDTVALAAPNSINFFGSCIAIWKCGASVLPLSPSLSPTERRAVLDVARPRLLITQTAPPTATTDACEADPAIVPIDLDVTEYSDGELPELLPTYWKAMTSGGSTGAPKLIVSHDEPRYDPEESGIDYVHADGVHLVCGPLYHNAAFVYSTRGLFAGNRLVILRRFDAGACLDAIGEHKVTWTQMVPTMMNRIRGLGAERLASSDLSSLDTLLHVGGPCSHDLKRFFLDWLGPQRIVEVYAGTESQGFVKITGEEWLEHPGSVGRAIRGSRFRILAATGEEVPPGTVGEVFLMPEGGPGSTYHYLGAEARSVDGWESLGDLGYCDEDGYLYLADRTTDCIVTGGANVYPAEVEGVLESHPDVLACAVIGLPDDDLGHRVVALIEPTGDVAPTPDALDAFVRERLISSKRPRAYEIGVQNLRDEAGKVRRSRLRAERMDGTSGPVAMRLPGRARWRDLRTGSCEVDDLLAVLDVDRIGDNNFRGRNRPRPTERIFGGQVLAQSLVAAARQVSDTATVSAHSLHGYFVRRGDPEKAVDLSVEVLREGRSFHLRRVDAYQDGVLICSTTISFQAPEPDHISHGLRGPSPTIPPDDATARFPYPHPEGADLVVPAPVELREGARASDPHAPSDVWMRVAAPLPDDDLLHQALLVFLSDFTILRAAFIAHDLKRPILRASASLDHSLWLHQRVRVDRWLHYVTSSPFAGGARALGAGAIYDESGNLAASAGQEMVVRLRTPRTSPPSTVSGGPAPHEGQR